MKVMHWCLPAQKNRFQLRVLNVPLGKSHIGDWALSYALHLRCEKFILGWQGNIVSIISEKINCFDKMLYRKIYFTFGGVTLFKRAIKCNTLNKMKKPYFIMKIMRWCLPAQKTRFQLRILNVPFGKTHIGDWALSYAIHLRREKFLLGWQGGIVFH